MARHAAPTSELSKPTHAPAATASPRRHERGQTRVTEDQHPSPSNAKHRCDTENTVVTEDVIEQPRLSRKARRQLAQLNAPSQERQLTTVGTATVQRVPSRASVPSPSGHSPEPVTNEALATLTDEPDHTVNLAPVQSPHTHTPHEVAPHARVEHPAEGHCETPLVPSEPDPTVFSLGFSPFTPHESTYQAPARASNTQARSASAAELPVVHPAKPHRKPGMWPKYVFAFTGSAALLLTLTLPGFSTLSPSSSDSTTSAQQNMHTTGSTGEAQSFDALNVVNVESEDTLESFYNFTNAEIQYPFAEGVTLSDPFGERSWPVSGFHDAQDFAAAAGTPVQVIADGTVLEAGFASDGCGFGLKVGHRIDGVDVTSRYCHMQMNSHDYRVGQQVHVGDHAGNVGNTGLSFGPHLHFVITVAGEAIDPMPFLLEHNRTTRQ